MQRLQNILKQSHTAWLFSLPEASALDAHLIAFIARMLDVGRQDLVPEVLKQYATKAMFGTEWSALKQGHITQYIAHVDTIDK